MNFDAPEKLPQESLEDYQDRVAVAYRVRLAWLYNVFVGRLASFTNGGRLNEYFGYFIESDYYSRWYSDLFDTELHYLPDDGFNVYDLSVINHERGLPSFYHVALMRDFDYIFHREVYPPLRSPRHQDTYGYWQERWPDCKCIRFVTKSSRMESKPLTTLRSRI